MKSLLIVILLVAVAMVSGASQSRSNSAQNPVEISGEPRHHPKFENEYVRIWDVTVPVGDVTLWHAHRNDNVVVSLSEVRLRIETLGRDVAEGPWKFGEVRFSKATYVHRAMNLGTTAFRNLTVELLKAPGGANLATQPGREPVVENERVRVFRVTLEPGQAGPMHTHTVPILAIALTSAELEVTTEGRAQPERVQRPAGNVLWRSEAVTHAIKNVGATRYEGVDVEFK